MTPAAAILILSAAQAHWASVAFNLGESHNGNGYLFAAIVYQESSFCKYSGTSWSRGCTGIKRGTARIFDKGVTRKQLTEDKNRNLLDGLSFLLYCREKTESIDAAAYCYHYGLPQTRKATKAEIERDGYVRAINDKIKQLRAIREDRE